ncbi:MAG TPA: T9SS type A sorting domain-containing protein [Flavobacteriales bacterium]|nr:T9SS type A sorting domain-containing protein [Flavobacteriales bacterium]
MVRDAFFSEDFSGGSIPAGWTNVDDLTPLGLEPVLFEWSNDPSDVSVAQGSFANLVGTFNAPGASNGYLWANSDRGLSAAPAENHLTRLTTSAIDCSGQLSIMLSMQSTIGVFDNDASEFVKIRVSTDLVTWTDFAPFPCLVTGDATPPCSRFSFNPEFVAVDISSVAADQATVYIQFEWQGGWEYWWGIDDLQLSPLPDYELIMNLAYNSTTGTGEEYGRIPASQLPGTMNVGAEITNFGANDQTNVELSVVFEDASGTTVPGFSTTVDLGTIASTTTVNADDNVNIPAGLPIGIYTSRYTVSSDDIALDNDPSNNIRTRNFEITEEVYSIDALGNHPGGTQSTQQYGTATFDDNTEIYYMSMYFLNAPMQATGVIVALGPATIPGQQASIQAMLLDTADITGTSATVANVIDGVTSNTHTITAADVAAGFVGLPFEQPINLTPGAYYAAVKLSGSGTVATENNTDPEVYILDDATVGQPAWTSAVFLPIDFNDDGTAGRQSYTNGNAFAIRLTSDPTVGLSEMEVLDGISIFPNPTAGVFQISSDRNEVLFVEVTDIMGKVVRTSTLSTLATMDMSDVAAGVYTVTVSNATERSVQRVTVK